MKYQEVDMQGKFWIQRVNGVPAHTSADEGRIIYDEISEYMYFASATEWVMLSLEAFNKVKVQSDTVSYIDAVGSEDSLYFIGDNGVTTVSASANSNIIISGASEFSTISTDSGTVNADGGNDSVDFIGENGIDIVNASSSSVGFSQPNRYSALEVAGTTYTSSTAIESILTLNFEGVDGDSSWVEESHGYTPDVCSEGNIDTGQYYSGSSSLVLGHPENGGLVRYALPTYVDNITLEQYVRSAGGSGSSGSGKCLVALSYTDGVPYVLIETGSNTLEVDIVDRVGISFTDEILYNFPVDEWVKVKFTSIGRTMNFYLNDTLYYTCTSGVDYPLRGGLPSWYIYNNSGYLMWVDKVTLTANIIQQTPEDMAYGNMDAITYADKINFIEGRDISFSNELHTVTGTPDDVSDLVLWLRADSVALNNGDPVTTITDKSSYGTVIDFTAIEGLSSLPVYKTNVINGHPAISFDTLSVNDLEIMAGYLNSLMSDRQAMVESATGLSAMLVFNVSSNSINDLFPFLFPFPLGPHFMFMSCSFSDYIVHLDIDGAVIDYSTVSLQNSMTMIFEFFLYITLSVELVDGAIYSRDIGGINGVAGLG